MRIHYSAVMLVPSCEASVAFEAEIGAGLMGSWTSSAADALER